MTKKEKLREIKIEQEPTQVTWRRCTQCNAAQMEFQLREEGICQKCYISNLEKENAELKAKLNGALDICNIPEFRISDLKTENTELKEELHQKSDTNHSLVEQLADKDIKVAELEEQIEVKKLQILELKAQIENMKCENSYVVSDEHLNSVPCYTFYECKHCCKRSW